MEANTVIATFNPVGAFTGIGDPCLQISTIPVPPHAMHLVLKVVCLDISNSIGRALIRRSAYDV